MELMCIRRHCRGRGGDIRRGHRCRGRSCMTVHAWIRTWVILSMFRTSVRVHVHVRRSIRGNHLLPDNLRWVHIFQLDSISGTGPLK